jgi:hypothetical protein
LLSNGTNVSTFDIEINHPNKINVSAI